MNKVFVGHFISVTLTDVRKYCYLVTVAVVNLIVITRKVLYKSRYIQKRYFASEVRIRLLHRFHLLASYFAPRKKQKRCVWHLSIHIKNMLLFRKIKDLSGIRITFRYGSLFTEFTDLVSVLYEICQNGSPFWQISYTNILFAKAINVQDVSRLYKVLVKCWSYKACATIFYIIRLGVKYKTVFNDYFTVILNKIKYLVI